MPKPTRLTRWLLRAGFVIALALTVFFGVKTTLSALYWRAPQHNDQVIEGWMPIGYIGRSWGLPREVIAEALGLDLDQPRRISIAQIAEDRGIPVEILAAQIAAVIADYRAAHHD